ncbi:hypothetical protein DM02DRAFT_245957 [Periconia macrospinosa]|uniref:Uncharacterized protein n=1 Tax=Periconia macrospinosa TaxID=97972 RepID=A0A2V1E261_9PLEO|nr:hypothetical protein DM02DRAFT_245957 [Periconia macrospinosa]
MAPSPPTVVHPPCTLPALLSHLLDSRAHSTGNVTTHVNLIVCSARAAFLHHLLASLEQKHGNEHQEQSPSSMELEHLIMPTLRNLATARHVHVSYCASVQALLAYLSTYSGAAAKDTGSHPRWRHEQIVLVNPLALHASTVSFSAQGLSRTFAVAVETATRLGAGLIVAECEKLSTNESSQQPDDMGVVTQRDEEQPDRNSIVDLDPWEHEVPILSPSTKKFGSGHSERPWAGRTVSVKRIVVRWFVFQELKA